MQGTCFFKFFKKIFLIFLAYFQKYVSYHSDFFFTGRQPEVCRMFQIPATHILNVFLGLYKLLKSKVCLKTQKFLQLSDVLFKVFFKVFLIFLAYFEKYVSYHSNFFYWKIARCLQSVLDTRNTHFGCVFGSPQALKVKVLTQNSEISTALTHAFQGFFQGFF